jgi:fatty acid desaturase
MSTPIDALVLTDPIHRPKARLNGFERFAMKFIRDERDIPFVKLIAVISITVIPFAVYLFLPGNFSWWLAIPYFALVLGYFLGPYILMLHNTSHRPFFKPEFRWMWQYVNWVMGPFFGETPETYYAHHIGMHHPENNLDDDLSCTMYYQRDSLRDFGRYFGRFFFVGIVELAMYLWKRKRYNLFWRAIAGELIFLVVAGLLLWYNWQATLVVFMVPFVFTRFAMMSGNWSQHAFLDAKAPDNIYRNSITCINSTYNRRCFNDGYHIGHHLKANRHWTEMPVDFERNRDTYAREGAIVFQGLDYFAIWFLLMTKQYGALAKRYVDLSGKNRSREEIIELLKERTKRIEPAAA